MKDIYDLLNNSKEDIKELPPVRLTEFEKRKIFAHVTARKKPKRAWRGVAVAAAAILVFTGIGISPVGAAIWSYFNDNTKNDYVEEPDKEIKTENAAMEVLSVSRNGNDIKIKCRFTFYRDISSLAEECEAYDKPQGNVLNAPPFKECTVLMNGQDLKADLHPDEKETVQGSLSCRNTEINGMTLVQTINILDFTPETTDDTISLRYRDIVIGGEKIAGEWNYEHTLNSDAYPDKELEKREIGITAVDSFGDTYTMDSFAVTPNGIKIFGTVQEKEKNVTEDVYPSQGKLIRIIAKDDLGNEYLLYPKYPSGGNEAVYELYTGPADVEDAYPDEWDPKATKVTIALQQEVLTWLSKTEIESEYPVISEEFTINLSE